MKGKNVKIVSLEIENLKRVSAVSLDCSGPLTVIGGRNGVGKTTCLDAIMWTLGGDKYKPSQPVKAGAEKAYSKVVLDNGIIVERKGIGGALKVTSPSGKGGQTLLNEFVSAFSLDLPKFMVATGIEKAKMLLESFPGLGQKLQGLNEQVKRLYAERLALGQIADQKDKYAKELPYIDGVPELPMSGADMAARLKESLTLNAHNDEIRKHVRLVEGQIKGQEYRIQSIIARRDDLSRQYNEALKELAAAEAERDGLTAALASAQVQAKNVKDSDTTAIEKELEDIDLINSKVRTNENKRNAEAEAKEMKEQYQSLSAKIDDIRDERLKLLSEIKMPMDGLSIDEEGELVFAGQRWDCMSGSEQLRVATAICASIKPACGFVLLDKLECMDTETLHEFGAWLDERDLQAIGTRVGTGEENSIIIEDGLVKGEEVELKL